MDTKLIKIICDIICTKEMQIALPADETQETIDGIVGILAENEFRGFIIPEGWYWSGDNVETESV